MKFDLSDLTVLRFARQTNQYSNKCFSQNPFNLGKLKSQRGVNKTRNMEHSGTSRNIPEHSGTFRNRANDHKINEKKSNKKILIFDKR